MDPIQFGILNLKYGLDAAGLPEYTGMDLSTGVVVSIARRPWGTWHGHVVLPTGCMVKVSDTYGTPEEARDALLVRTQDFEQALRQILGYPVY